MEATAALKSRAAVAWRIKPRDYLAASEAAEAAVSAALSAPPQAAKAKDNKAAANRDFFIFEDLF